MSVIDRCLRHTRSLDADQTKIDALEAEAARLRIMRDDLLPIEESARAHVEARLEETNREKARLITAQVIDLPALDPVVFTWTKRQESIERRLRGSLSIEVPVLAYVPLLNQNCWISASDWSVRHSSYTPDVIKRAWKTIGEGMCAQVRDQDLNSMTISYAYDGLIPDDIRGKIHESQRTFDHLALVCEVDRWNVSTVAKPQPPRVHLDPILVGHKADTLWVLGAFDPTPVEKYLADEFTA